MAFKPAVPFGTAMKLLTPVTTKIQGVTKKTYSAPEDSDLFYASFRTFGGTEDKSNDALTLIDTAVINCWYRPDIKADCQIYICDTGEVYDIIGRPEDIDMRHQYLQFKVRKAGGKP